MCTPIFAAEDDYKGWFAALDLATTQPNSLDQHFANHQDPSTTPVFNERLAIDNGTDFTFQATIGYGFGKGLGSLRASYWSFDNEDTMSETRNGYVLPSIFGYGYSGAMYIYNPAGVPFTATSKVKASTVDLDYVRPLASGEKTSLSWLAGLRVASYEEDRGFLGTDGVNDYAQAKHFESSAAGLRVGAQATFGFTKHFSLESSLVLSFLQGDTEGNSSQLFVASGAEDTNEAKDDHITGEIRDFDVRAVWSYGALDYYLGYSMSSWNGLVTDPVPTIDTFGSGSTSDRGRDNISFNSLHGGVIWRFGKRGFNP